MLFSVLNMSTIWILQLWESSVHFKVNNSTFQELFFSISVSFILCLLEYLIEFKMLTKKYLFDSEKQEKKNTKWTAKTSEQ